MTGPASRSAPTSAGGPGPALPSPAWKSLKVAIFGYAMNDMSDIRVDESALVRSLGPEILAVAPGDMYRGMLAVTDDEAATLVSLEGERFRLVVAEGENLDSQELPALEMPYGQFRPGTGLRGCLNGWLAAGGPHHEVDEPGPSRRELAYLLPAGRHRVRAGLTA